MKRYKGEIILYALSRACFHSVTSDFNCCAKAVRPCSGTTAYHLNHQLKAPYQLSFDSSNVLRAGSAVEYIWVYVILEFDRQDLEHIFIVIH